MFAHPLKRFRNSCDVRFHDHGWVSKLNIRASILRTTVVSLLLWANLGCWNVAVAETDRPRIGLVLSGGGARGLAHVGVLKALEELRVPVDCIAGTSMGALVGGAYAAGVSPEEMQRQVQRIDWDNIFRDNPPRTEIPYKIKRDDFQSYFDLELGLRDGQLLAPAGATTGFKVEFFIRELIGLSAGRHDQEFDSLPVPFRAVATDLESGTAHVFSNGDLGRVMRASMSVPGVIAPVTIDGRMYVDGGLLNNLPVDTVREMCADIVIAVNLGTPLMTQQELQSMFSVSTQSINLLTEQNVKRSMAALKESDVLLSPELNDLGSGDFGRVSEAIARGENAARDALARLESLRLDTEAYVAWQRQRESRIAKPSPVTDYRFEPTQHVASSMLAPEMQLSTGESFSLADFHESLIRMYGRGDLQDIQYHFADREGARSIVVEPVEKAWGPNYLRFGFGFATDLNSSARVSFNASHRATWLNSRGAEWRNDAQFGYRNRLATELYQPYSATRGSVFVSGGLEYATQPVIFYVSGRRFGEYDVTTLRTHLDVGATDHRGEIRLGLFAGKLKTEEDFGFLTLPNKDLNQRGATLSLSYDQLDNADFPGRGTAFGAKYRVVRSDGAKDDQYESTELEYRSAYSWGRHVVEPAVFAGSMFSNTFHLYDMYQLGGFLRLSGYHFDELVGTGYVLARAVYLYRTSRLPTQVGGGTYFGSSLEAGRVREGIDAEVREQYQIAASIFLGAETILGPVRLALGHSESGRTSVYFTLGRLLAM